MLILHRTVWWRTLACKNSARGKLEEKTSHIVKLCECVPQGSVISTTLFLVFINDIMKHVPPRISGALHADGCLAFCREHYHSICSNARHPRPNKHMDNRLGSGSEHKKNCCSMSKKKETFTLRMNGKELRNEETPSYLGVTLDRTLTWRYRKQ